MITDFETKLLDQMFDPIARFLTPEAAAYIVGIRADAKAQERVDELAEKCEEGRLSADERGEYEAYISAANVLAILQAKARRRIAGSAAN